MTKNGINAEQRDIILIPFPYTNLSQNKKRPAFVLSNKEHNQHNEDLICCALTSNPRNYENSIEINKNDLESDELVFESRIKPNKIFTLNKELIIKKLARLNVIKTKEVIEKLNCFIRLAENQ